MASRKRGREKRLNVLQKAMALMQVSMKEMTSVPGDPARMAALLVVVVGALEVVAVVRRVVVGVVVSVVRLVVTGSVVRVVVKVTDELVTVVVKVTDELVTVVVIVVVAGDSVPVVVSGVEDCVAGEEDPVEVPVTGREVTVVVSVEAGVDDAPPCVVPVIPSKLAHPFQ